MTTTSRWSEPHSRLHGFVELRVAHTTSGKRCIRVRAECGSAIDGARALAGPRQRPEPRPTAGCFRCLPPLPSPTRRHGPVPAADQAVPSPTPLAPRPRPSRPQCPHGTIGTPGTRRGRARGHPSTARTAPHPEPPAAAAAGQQEDDAQRGTAHFTICVTSARWCCSLRDIGGGSGVRTIRGTSTAASIGYASAPICRGCASNWQGRLASQADRLPGRARSRSLYRSGCVKSELVAVRVGQLNAVRQVGKSGRTERDQSFCLAGGASGDQVEALPVPSGFAFHRRSAP